MEVERRERQRHELRRRGENRIEIAGITPGRVIADSVALDERGPRAGLRELVGDAGAEGARAHDDDVRRLQRPVLLVPRSTAPRSSRHRS